jgi:hypothetical protein
MQNPKIFNLLVNMVGALLGLLVVGYVAYSAMRSDAEPPCSTSYPAPTRFALRTNQGTPLTPIQLQARAGATERGMLENAAVVPAGDAPTGEALEVQLGHSGKAANGKPPPSTGVNFRWSPPGMAGASAACLTYSVWLPEGFAYGGGGLLPGIFGGQPPGPGSASNSPPGKAGFGTRIMWAENGQALVQIDAGTTEFRTPDTSSFLLGPGRWIKIEQEVVLNAPGQADGAVRLWSDGKLVSEQGQQALRSDAKSTISGVLAEILYLREPDKGGMLRISPFEMAWR